MKIGKATAFIASVIITSIITSRVSGTTTLIEVEENKTSVLPCDHKTDEKRQFIISWYNPPESAKSFADYRHFMRDIFIRADLAERVNFTEPPIAGTLAIRRTEMSDEGSYGCKVVSYTTIRRDVNLVVTVPPKFPLIVGVDIALKEGSNASVTCYVTRVKPAQLVEVTWTIQDNPITGVTNSTQNLDGKTFTIENTIALSPDRQQDGNIIGCHVRWNNMTDFTKATKILNVNYPPRSICLIPGGTTRVNQITTVSITCQTDARGAKPLPTLSIYREGFTQPVKTQDNTTQITHVMIIQRDDNGKAFQCKATGGVITGSISSSNVTYEVLYPAAIVAVTGVNGPVIEGRNVTLGCQAVDGNPDTYSYKWIHIHDGQMVNLTETTSRFTLSDIQYTAAGRYICQATNEYGPTEGSVELIIHYSPKKDPKKKTIFKVRAKYGETKKLTMHVIALPVGITYIWFHGQKQMEREKVSNNGLNSTLTLVNITNHDFGTYTCQANNSVNQESEFVFCLLAPHAPLPPIHYDVIRTTAVSLTVRWRRNSDGGYVQHFKVRYKKMVSSEREKESDAVNDPFPTSNYTQAKLKALDAETEYELYVVAFSDFNQGCETKSDPFSARTVARPHINSDKLTVDRRGNEAKLTWSRPTGQYTHYIIEWCEKPGKTNCNNESQENETTSTTISGLRSGQEYTFVLKVYDGDDLVRETGEFKSPSTGGSAIVVAIVVPMLLIAAIALVTIIVVIKKRQQRAKPQNTGDMQSAQRDRALDTRDYENPFDGNTSDQVYYSNAVFDDQAENVSQNSKKLNSPGNETLDPAIHVYDQVQRKVTADPERIYVNTHGASKPQNTDGAYEQLRPVEESTQANREPAVYEKIRQH